MLVFVRSAVLPLAVAAGLFATPRPSSDPIGIYAVVDRVVVAPDSVNPQTIQIWGVFAISEGVPGDRYKPAARGYLYFKMNPANQRAVRAEWADIKGLAGKGVFGFGAHWINAPGAHPRVRCASEAPRTPDDYTTSIGVVRSLSNPPNTIADALRNDLTSGKAPAAPCQ